jgi:hypothetical protein
MRLKLTALTKFLQYIALIAMVATAFVVLNFTDIKLKVIASMIGGGLFGLSLATRVFLMSANLNMTCAEANKNIKEVGNIIDSHPLKKSLIDIDKKLAGNSSWLPDGNTRASVKGISTLKSVKFIVGCFLFSAFLLYGSFLHTDLQSILSLVKNMMVQVVAVISISIGFLGLFLNLLGVPAK